VHHPAHLGCWSAAVASGGAAAASCSELPLLVTAAARIGLGACELLDCASRERTGGARAAGAAALLVGRRERAGEGAVGGLLTAGEGRAGEGAVLGRLKVVLAGELTPAAAAAAAPALLVAAPGALRELVGRCRAGAAFAPTAAEVVGSLPAGRGRGLCCAAGGAAGLHKGHGSLRTQ
jgi:hypothetical protein